MCTDNLQDLLFATQPPKSLDTRGRLQGLINITNHGTRKCCNDKNTINLQNPFLSSNIPNNTDKRVLVITSNPDLKLNLGFSSCSKRKIQGGSQLGGGSGLERKDFDGIWPIPCHSCLSPAFPAACLSQGGSWDKPLGPLTSGQRVARK